MSPVEILVWLTLPHPDLVVGRAPVSPRTWLVAGRDPAVVVAATADFVNR